MCSWFCSQPSFWLSNSMGFGESEALYGAKDVSRDFAGTR